MYMCQGFYRLVKYQAISRISFLVETFIGKREVRLKNKFSSRSSDSQLGWVGYSFLQRGFNPFYVHQKLLKQFIRVTNFFLR